MPTQGLEATQVTPMERVHIDVHDARIKNGSGHDFRTEYRHQCERLGCRNVANRRLIRCQCHDRIEVCLLP